MKIAITSICAVLLLYVVAQLFLRETDEPAPIAATPQELPPEVTPPKPPFEPSLPEKPIEESALNEANQPTESLRERYTRLHHELELRKSEMSSRNFILEGSILNAELALAENPKTSPSPLTEKEKALLEDFKNRKKSGEPNPGDTILAAIDETSSPAMYFIAGNLFAESGDLENAIDFYATALDTDQEISQNLRGRTNRNLGIMLVKKGDFERSKSYLREAIYLTEEPNTTLHGLLGLAELNSGNLAASEYHYKKAIAIDSKVYDWQVGLAKNLLKQEKYEEAIDLMNAMKEDPHLAQVEPKG